MDGLILFIIIILFALEVAAVFLPVLPDTVFFWTAVILYRFLKTDVSYSPYFLAGAVIITIIILLADYLSNLYFIKKQGGSKRTIFTAILGMVVGTIFFGPIGFILLPFISIFIVEYWRSRNRSNSLKLAFSSILAFLAGTIARLTMQLFLMAWFLIEIY